WRRLRLIRWSTNAAANKYSITVTEPPVLSPLPENFRMALGETPTRSIEQFNLRTNLPTVLFYHNPAFPASARSLEILRKAHAGGNQRPRSAPIRFRLAVKETLPSPAEFRALLYLTGEPSFTRFIDIRRRREVHVPNEHALAEVVKQDPSRLPSFALVIPKSTPSTFADYRAISSIPRLRIGIEQPETLRKPGSKQYPEKLRRPWRKQYPERLQRPWSKHWQKNTKVTEDMQPPGIKFYFGNNAVDGVLRGLSRWRESGVGAEALKMLKNLEDHGTAQKPTRWTSKKRAKLY
ncbi:hypothetical protein C8F01DRAFT_1119885, partial [Mycena amicta]